MRVFHSKANVGFTNTLIRALAIDPGTPQTVYAGTFTNGVAKTTDGGTTWNLANTGLSEPEVTALAVDPATPPIVFVTHHVEEIPPGFTHALLLRQGRVVASGPLATALTADALSRCFDLDLDLEVQLDSGGLGRYSARTRRRVGPPTDPPHPP